MKKIKIEWDEKNEKLLKRQLLNLLIVERPTKEELEKAFLPLRKRLKKLAVKTKIQDKDTLEKILTETTKEFLNVYKFLNEFIKSKKYSDLTEEEKHIKRLSKVTLGSRHLQGYIYLKVLREIAKDTDYYVWQTMKDTRVRDTHRVLQGKICSIKDSVILPQEEINCRCYAIILYPSNKQQEKALKTRLFKENVKQKNDRLKKINALKGVRD